MTRSARRSLLLASALALLGVGYWLLPEPASEQIRDRLSSSAELVRHPGGLAGSALREALRAVLTDDAVVSTGELPPIAPGPDGVAELLERARARYTRIGLDVTSIAVRLDADGRSATAQADALLTLVEPGAVRDEARKLTARLVSVGGGWKIAALTVAAKTYAEPEARP